MKLTLSRHIPERERRAAPCPGKRGRAERGQGKVPHPHPPSHSSPNLPHLLFEVGCSDTSGQEPLYSRELGDPPCFHCMEAEQKEGGGSWGDVVGSLGDAHLAFTAGDAGKPPPPHAPTFCLPAGACLIKQHHLMRQLLQLPNHRLKLLWTQGAIPSSSSSVAAAAVAVGSSSGGGRGGGAC